MKNPFKLRLGPIGSNSIALYESCPATSVYMLPRVPSDEARSYGIQGHTFMEYVNLHGREFAMEWLSGRKNTPNIIECCKNIDTSQIPAGEVEVGYFHNIHTDVGRRGDLKTDKMNLSQEQHGRADLVVLDQEVPHVIDWKFGLKAGDPRKATQLYGLQAAVRSETKAKEVDISLVGVQGNGSMVWWTHRVTEAEHKAFVARAASVQATTWGLRASLKQGKHSLIVFNEGPHCKWCDLKSACPSIRKCKLEDDK